MARGAVLRYDNLEMPTLAPPFQFGIRRREFFDPMLHPDGLIGTTSEEDYRVVKFNPRGDSKSVVYFRMRWAIKKVWGDVPPIHVEECTR